MKRKVSLWGWGLAVCVLLGMAAPGAFAKEEPGIEWVAAWEEAVQLAKDRNLPVIICIHKDG